MTEIIIFLGAPGSGKGTQASKLADGFGFKHISTGDMLRSNVKLMTDLGMKANNYMKNGDLVPDNLIIEMVMDSLSSYKESTVILDGFPRTENQAMSLDSKINVLDLILKKVLFLDVNDQDVVGRLALRGRDDDSHELVINRLNVYKKETAPLLEYYKSTNRLIRIEGGNTTEEVFGSVIENLSLNNKNEVSK
jgi:adenylate kinase